MLWLAISLADLPLEVFSRAVPSDRPFAVSTGEGRAPSLLAVNRAAARLGLRPGMGVGAAHALARGLLVQARDARREHETLERLATWAGQFTSQVSITPPHTLLLEVQGSERLFGGREALWTRVQATLAALGFRVVSALAPTPLAAQWLAHAGVEVRVHEASALVAALAPLPITCLGLESRAQQTLLGVGVRRLGDCLRLPRDGLARRLGAEFLLQLDRALGRAPDLRPLHVPPARYEGNVILPGSVETTEGLLFALQRLLLELEGFLRARGAGVQAMRLTLHHNKGEPTTIAFGLAAVTRESAHCLVLWRERLARVTLTAPVEEIVLRAEAAAPFVEQSRDFFTPRHAEPQARTALIERLRARLGEEAVRGLAFVAEHRPEYAWRYVAPGEAGEGAAARERPLWLLPAPMALEERDGVPWLDGALLLAPDIERIEAGWWSGEGVRRDYYVARDARGAVLWVFREISGARSWFLHGVFG